MIEGSFPSAIRGRSMDLLARAALAPPAEAKAAWRQWRATCDIDKTPWPEVRMLGAVAARIEMLEPDASIRPRVLGIRKFLWVQSQMCLQQAAGGLAALRREGIPVLLMKGAARIASDPASAQERLIRDVDALVPTDRQQQAFEVLCGEGWVLVPQPWQLEARAWDPVAAHHAWSLAKGRSEIDLHHYSNHLNRLRGDDEGLWARSLELEWRGVPVRVPSPADALLLALTHGVRWSQDASGDWAVDASALLDAGNVDWTVFVAEAEARLLQGIALTGLVYLRDALGKRVPPEALDVLRSGVTPEQRAELAQYRSSAGPHSGSQVSTALAMALRRAAARDPRVVRGSMETTARRVLLDACFEVPETQREHGIEWALDPPPDGGARLEIKVTIARPQGLGRECIACTLGGPGLAFVLGVGERADPRDPDSPRVVSAIVPERLLELRDITKIRISFWTKRHRGALSARVTVSRARLAG